MTVTADIPSFIQTPGNGTAVSFSFPFKIFQASDLIVGFITSTGYGQQTSGFSVQNVDVNGGGNVVFTTAPPSGTTVDIRSVTPKIQNTEFANLGSFLPENHTEAFDRLTRMVQDLYRLVYTFGIHGPDQEGTAWTALPAANQRALKAMLFDANGLPTVGSMSVSATAGSAVVLGSLAALRATSPTGGLVSDAFVLGFASAGDGGGGIYYYNSTDTTSADDGGSIIVSGDGGRWYLAYPWK